MERELDVLKGAVRELKIPCLVAQDNEGETWWVYDIRYWPTIFLINKRGNIRYTHIGEGAYQDTEHAIQSLLAEPYL